jgi:hypothetical protein
MAETETELKAYRVRVQQKPAPSLPSRVAGSAMQGANDHKDNKGENAEGIRRCTVGFGQFPKDMNTEDIVSFGKACWGLPRATRRTCSLM